MHRIFTIPELVSAILTEFVSHGTRGSLVRGPLTVCKLWADVTMDLIWRQIYDPIVIFCLLAPVEDQPRDEDDPYRQGCVSSKKEIHFHMVITMRFLFLTVIQNSPCTEWMGPL